MVLIRSGGLSPIEPERICRAGAIGRIQVWVVGEKRGGQPVDRRRIGRRYELVFSRGIQRVGIGSEVVIEGNVLVENYHQVLNRRRGGVSDCCVFCFLFDGRSESGTRTRSHGNGHHQ